MPHYVDGLTMEAIFNLISYERMKRAVENLVNDDDSVSDDIFDYLMGNRKLTALNGPGFSRKANLNLSGLNMSQVCLI